MWWSRACIPGGTKGGQEWSNAGYGGCMLLSLQTQSRRLINTCTLFLLIKSSTQYIQHDKVFCILNYFCPVFLAHLSQRLKWAFLIKICPLSVVVVVVIGVVEPRPFPGGDSENTLTKLKNLLLQNHWANFNQTWHKTSLGEWDSSLFKWRSI